MQYIINVFRSITYSVRVCRRYIRNVLNNYGFVLKIRFLKIIERWDGGNRSRICQAFQSYGTETILRRPSNNFFSDPSTAYGRRVNNINNNNTFGTEPNNKCDRQDNYGREGGEGLIRF